MRRLLPFLLTILLASCYVFKAYRFRKFDLKDLHKIEAVDLPASPTPFKFFYDTLNNATLAQYLDSNLQNSQSYAFLVIRNDSILYERYFGDVTPSTVLPSFSAAKSVTGTLFGIALGEGKIKSVQEPITAYLPELRKRNKDWDKVTLQDVLNMRSGVKSNESYTNPFSDVLKLGFAGNVDKYALKSDLEGAPGNFEYRSVNTQLLSMVIERATGRKMQDYAVEKLWTPLQMEFPATWNDDKHQTVRAFCCINAAARDYAKFGRLFLHDGSWNGKQIVPAAWVQASTDADTMFTYGGYKNQWWAQAQRQYFTDSMKAVQFRNSRSGKTRLTLAERGTNAKQYTVTYYNGAYYAAGLLGQYVYINPAKNLLIVRLGHDWYHPKMYAVPFIYNLGDRL